MIKCLHCKAHPDLMYRYDKDGATYCIFHKCDKISVTGGFATKFQRWLWWMIVICKEAIIRKSDLDK